MASPIYLYPVYEVFKGLKMSSRENAAYDADSHHRMIVPEYTMMQGVRINERAQACSDIQREAVQCAGRGREVG